MIMFFENIPAFIFDELNESVAELGISVETIANGFIYQYNGIGIGNLANDVVEYDKYTKSCHLELYVPKSIGDEYYVDKNNIKFYRQYHDGYVIVMELNDKINLVLEDGFLKYDFSQISEKILYSIGMVQKAMLEIEKRNIKDEKLGRID